MSEQFIAPDQLCVGLYVQLDLGWMDHPFAFSSFKIKSQEQVDLLRRMRLPRIKYDPGKSAAKPLPSQPPATALPQATATAESVSPESAITPENAQTVLDQLVKKTMQEKEARIEQMRTLRTDIEQVEKKFAQVADSVKNITKQLQTNPQAAIDESHLIINKMAETMMDGGDLMLHAISENCGEDAYHHSLNVSVLAMMLAKAADEGLDIIQQVGLGALLHDVGKIDVPYKVASKAEPLSKPERMLIEKHCEFGLKRIVGSQLHDNVKKIIAHHHEYVDGSGYPARLKGDAIHVAAKIVCIANHYDNLCNPAQVTAAITPSEALSQMFALKRDKFDDRLLKLFIKRLGIYPPGSIIQLSNEKIGLVVSVNSEHPLKPNVLVYDTSVPKDDAIIISLESEPDLKVVKSLRPSLLPRQVHQYLNPRKNVTYFFDPKTKATVS